MMNGTVVSIFSGCGGLDLGFKELGFDLLYACDLDPCAVDCYGRNVHPKTFVRDVMSRQFHDDIAAIATCDVVLGGFPCQGFSKAGPKRREDSRNVLYTEMRDAIARLKPKVFIAENVDGLSQNFRGNYLDMIINEFANVGYDVGYRILDAVAYGVPQHRRRIIFVGTKRGCGQSFEWPAPTHSPRTRNGEFRVQDGPLLWGVTHHQNQPLNGTLTIRDAIADLTKLDSPVPDHKIGVWPSRYNHIFGVIKEGQKLCNVRHSATSVYTWDIPEVFGTVTERERLILETIARNRRHKEYGEIPNGNPLPLSEIERLSELSGIEDEITSLMQKRYLKRVAEGYDLKGALFCSGMFKRPKWDEPAPTVLTNFHNPRYFLHPSEDRPFSLRECARFQGFPDNFHFLSSAVDLISGYRLVGNAVPPPLSRCIAKAVGSFLVGSQPMALAQ